MAKRASWLIGLNFVLPGSAQLLAGSRGLGRFAIRTTFLLWFLIAVLLVAYLVVPTVVYSVFTSTIGLVVIQILLAGYALLWFILTIDTLRLAKLVRTAPLARVVLAIVVAGSLVVTVGTASYGAYVSGIARSAIVTVFHGGAIADPIDGRYNIMLLGGDAGPGRVGLRPDSISVVSIDATTGAATIIGIPRNLEKAPFSSGSPLYGPYPHGYDCGNNCLISYLYTYGQEHPALFPRAAAAGSEPGVEAMRAAVEGVTGLTMQYFVLIDMQGFSDLIDALGGITIAVPEKVVLGKNGDAPIGAIPAGVQKMNGATALWYARSRYDTTDYARMQRQRQVQEAILAQFQPSNVLTKFQGVANAGVQVVKTDIPQSMLPQFVELATKSHALPVTTLELVPPLVVTAHPNFDAIHAAVAQAIAPVAPSGSPKN